MQNTDAIKWDATISKLKSFIGTMRQMESCRNDEDRVYCLKCLLRDNRISRQVYSLVMEICELVELDKKYKFNPTRFRPEDFIRNKKCTFGVLVKDISNKGLRDNLCLRERYEDGLDGILNYHNVVSKHDVKSIDDLALNFLQNEKNREKIAKLGKDCKTIDDVYRDLDVCAMFIHWLTSIGCFMTGNKAIFNEWIDDQSLATIFNTKNSKNQIFIAAGICECLSKIDNEMVYAKMAEEVFKDKKFMTKVQLKAASYIIDIMSGTWSKSDDSQNIEKLNDLVSKLFFKSSIAIPKDPNGKQYYSAGRFIDIYGTECYAQFVKGLKTGEGLRAIKMQLDYVNKEDLSSDEYINVLIKNRLKIWYILKVADVLHKNETVNFANCM